MITPLIKKSLVRKSPVVNGLLVKGGSSGGWSGKPSSWPDIRRNLIPNSIRLLADNRYPLGFTATVTGGYIVKINGEVKGTYASGEQCSIPQTDWPKGGINSLTAYGATEQRNLPAGHTQLEYVYMTNGSYIRIEDLLISAGYKVEFEFQTKTLGSTLRNYFGGRADGVSAGGGFRLSKLASGGTSLNRVVLYGFETGTEYYDPTTQFQANTKYKYTYNNGVCTLESGGSVISTQTFTVTDNTSTPWGINDYFGNGAWSAYRDDIYVYSVKVWNTQGELVMDLVPDLTSANVVCFYDMVTGTLREATAGTFMAGPEAVPTPDTPMDIISNNGVLKATHQSGLPLGYKLVDYIKASAMIELDKPTNETMEFVAKFYREGSNAQYVYQSDTSSSGTTNTTSYISSGGNWRFGRRTASISVDTEVMITSVQNASGVWLNGEQVAIYEGVTAFTSTNNLRLFGTQATPQLRLYWLKVYQNGALFYDLIPCQRESDSAYGVYDLVNGKFFTNSDATITIGSFVSDPVVAKGTGPIETIADTGYYGNLIDLNALTSGYYYNSSGVYTSASNVYLTDWIRVYNGDTITVYCKKTPDANAPVIRMNIFDAQKNWVSQSTMTLNNQDEDVTVLNITANGYIRISGASNLVDWNAVQIIRGNYTVETIPDYKAYVPYHTATCGDLFSIGDYTDVQSILDGVVTRNVGELVLDGTENWIVISGSYPYFGVDYDTDFSLSTNTYGGFCSHFRCVNTGSTQNNQGVSLYKYSGTNKTRLGLRYSNLYPAISENIPLLKQWLAAQYAAGTPVIIVYPLATPTTETVTGQTLTGTTATVTAGGIDNLQITYTRSSGGYPINYPTGAETAHIVDIYPTTEGNNITQFRCRRVAESGNEEQGVLWGHFNITNTINLDTGFAYDGVNYNPVMLACTAKNNLIKANGLITCFYNASSLEYLPIIDAQNNTVNIYGLFARNIFTKVDIKNLKFAEGSNAFYLCQNIKKLPKGIDYSEAVYMGNYLASCSALEDTVLDVSAATKLKRIGCYGWTDNFFMGGFKGLRVSNEAPFDYSSAPQIDVSYTGLDRNALVTLFNDLPTVTGGQIINVTGCTGTADLTADDKAIATDKGWTVTL